MASTIAANYPNDHLSLQPGEWLVADEGTAQTVSEKIGVGFTDPKNAALVVGVSNYFGRQPPEVWDWIKAKWGGGPHGPS